MMNNPFEQPTTRRGIMTLSNGEKVQAEFSIYPKPRWTQREYELELVESFNRSQPNLVNKVVKIHLMRN